jgi:deoxyribodipyrimidine photo-lyase
VISFVLELAQKNIPGIQIFVGEFQELQQQFSSEQATYFIDHPLHRHFQGYGEPYPWLVPQVQGSFSSFFSFWKKAEKYLK